MKSVAIASTQMYLSDTKAHMKIVGENYKLAGGKCRLQVMPEANPMVKLFQSPIISHYLNIDV